MTVRGVELTEEEERMLKSIVAAAVAFYDAQRLDNYDNDNMNVLDSLMGKLGIEQ